MKFIELIVYNFGPYKGEQSISFPSDSSQKVMVVFGDNMRGKTTLLNSLRWVLYGTALDRHLNEMDTLKLINTEAQRDREWKAWVSLRFESDGHEYELRRIVEPKELISIPRSKRDFKITTMMRKDGSLITPDLIEHHINQLIPEQISRFYLFDGELLQEYEMLLLEDNLQGEKIKDAIEQVLGVPALINGKIHIQTLLKNAQKMQAKECEHVKTLESQAKQSSQLQEEIRSHQEDLKSLEEQKGENQTKIKEINDELDKEKDVQETNAKIEYNEQRLRALKDNEKDLLERKHNTLRNAWKDLLQPRLRLRLNEIENKISSFQNNIAKRGKLQARIEALEKTLNTTSCTQCGNQVSQDKREELGQKLGEVQGELTLLQHDFEEETFRKLNEEHSKLSRILGTNAAEDLRRIDQNLNETLVNITKLESETETLRDSIKGHDTARIAQLGKQKEAFLKIQGKIEKDIETVTLQIEDKRNKLAQLAKLMSKNPEARKQRGTKEVEMYSALEQIFSESIDLLRERLRSKVADEASNVFSNLTTEKTYSGLQINNNYGLTILDRLSEPVSVRSAGAEQIVALALITALNRTANKPAPVVMDTPLGRLDPNHRENILKFLPNMAEQVVMFVHEGEISRERGLEPVIEKVGTIYEIERVSSSHSRLKRAEGVTV